MAFVFIYTFSKKTMCGNYVHFPIMEAYCTPFELHYSLHLQKILDHILRLSRRDFPGIALDIKYTSLEHQDFHLTFISTNFLF